MRLKILSPVNTGDQLLQAGAIVYLPEKDALALIRAKAAEPWGRPAIDVWAVHAAADLAAQQRREAWMAEMNEKATPKIEFLGGGWRASR